MRRVVLARRAFLAGATALLAALRSRAERARPSAPDPARRVEIAVAKGHGAGGRQVVSLGVPLPPGLLADPDAFALEDERGREVEAIARPLEPWRLDGRDGSIRALLVQFVADVPADGGRRVFTGVFGRARKRGLRDLVPAADALVEPSGLQGLRALATLPPAWLCASWVAGPQVPAAASGPYAAYEELVARSFPDALQHVASRRYADWLFDRTSCWYTMYARTGEARYLDAAVRAAHFVRGQTVADGPDAGAFALKGADLKYVYPRAMHLHYLLTGDERARETGRRMAEFCLSRWDPVYRPDAAGPPKPDTDPEARSGFWSPRHQAYGFLGVLHGYELTGDTRYRDAAGRYADALDAHQRQPPDGRPADGSFRQDWSRYDPSEATYTGATSAWMSAILVAPIFHHWWLSGDVRVPPMIARLCDFLDRRAFTPDGSKAYYVVDCFRPEGAPQPEGENDRFMAMHNLELAYVFAMGAYFAADGEQRRRFRRRFQKLYESGVTLDFRSTPRAYNWAFQASSQLVYFMDELDRPAPGSSRPRPGGRRRASPAGSARPG